MKYLLRYSVKKGAIYQKRQTSTSADNQLGEWEDSNESFTITLSVLQWRVNIKIYEHAW